MRELASVDGVVMFKVQERHDLALLVEFIDENERAHVDAPEPVKGASQRFEPVRVLEDLPDLLRDRSQTGRVLPCEAAEDAVDAPLDLEGVHPYRAP